MFIFRVQQNILPSCLLVPCRSREQRAESREQRAESREQTLISSLTFITIQGYAFLCAGLPTIYFCQGHETALIGFKVFCNQNTMDIIYNLWVESLCRLQTVCVCFCQEQCPTEGRRGRSRDDTTPRGPRGLKKRVSRPVEGPVHPRRHGGGEGCSSLQEEKNMQEVEDILGVLCTSVSSVGG